MLLVFVLLGAASVAGSAYLLFAADAVRRFGDRPSPAIGEPRPVSILKPLCGAEAGLYANLLSFCRQDHPAYEVLMAIQDPEDPALPVAGKVASVAPEGRPRVIVDARIRGTNRKVSNLETVLAEAAHDLFVIADSDMRVAPTYLREITGLLEDPEVGLVTCLYVGRSAGGVWADLGAMFINYGFLPSVLAGERLQPGEACFGATMAMRRDTLERIGGLASLRDQLADDYQLGAQVRAAGLRIALSPHLVDTFVSESHVGSLLRHELRWARTVRLIAPAGYLGSAITHASVLGFMTLLAGSFSLVGWAIFGVAIASRLHLVRTVNGALGLRHAPFWLLPLRDVLSFAIFVASFLGRSVAWRGRTLRVGADGRMTVTGEAPT